MRRLLVAAAAFALVVPAVTVAVSTAAAPDARAAGVCTEPEFVLQGHESRGLGDYYADGNIWNDNGRIDQTMDVCAHDSWSVGVSADDHDDKAVLSYPNVHRDYHDWSTAEEPRIDSFDSITSTFAHRAPEGGTWNVAYDVWINGVGNGPGTTELMIWTQNSGQRPAGDKRDTVTLAGHEWELWTTDDGEIVSFVATKAMTSGTLDLQAFTTYLMDTDRLPADSTLGQVGYGVEIVQTGGAEKRFDFTDFSVSTT